MVLYKLSHTHTLLEPLHTELVGHLQFWTTIPFRMENLSQYILPHEVAFAELHNYAQHRTSPRAISVRNMHYAWRGWGEHVLQYYYVCLCHQNIYSEAAALYFQMGTLNPWSHMYCSVEQIPGHILIIITLRYPVLECCTRFSYIKKGYCFKSKFTVSKIYFILA
jgi:hypothetical protein